MAQVRALNQSDCQHIPEEYVRLLRKIAKDKGCSYNQGDLLCLLEKNRSEQARKLEEQTHRSAVLEHKPKRRLQRILQVVFGPARQVQYD